MDIRERQILSDIRTIMVQTASHTNERDTDFLYTVTQLTIDSLLQAGEPINKGKRSDKLYAQTEELIAHTKDFMQYREAENWRKESMYPYQLSTSIIKKQMHVY